MGDSLKGVAWLNPNRGARWRDDRSEVVSSRITPFEKAKLKQAFSNLELSGKSTSHQLRKLILWAYDKSVEIVNEE